MCKTFRKCIVGRKEEKPNAVIPPDGISFEVRVETDMNQVYKLLQKALQAYRDEKKGPTFVALQVMEDVKVLQNKVSILNEFPHVQIHFHASETRQEEMRYFKTSFFRIWKICTTLWSGKKWAPKLWFEIIYTVRKPWNC